MILHAKGARAQTALHPVFKEQIQPNAVELTAGHIFEILPGEFVLDKDKKIHLQRSEMLPAKDGYFHLNGGSYLVEFEQRVMMGPKEAAIVISRSTLMRNGVQLTSALYDSGYYGSMTALLTIPEGVTFVFPAGERLAQFVVFEAEALSLYNGSYQGK